MVAAPLASRIFDANGELLLLDVRGLGGVALQLSGTFTLTVQFEATVDGQTWVSLRMLPSSSVSGAPSSTSAGAWSANVAGLKLIRARVSAYTSGSADVTFLASSASGRVGASGGDAETLDGEDGSYYLDVDNMTAGTLAVNRGGTGAATHTSGSVLLGAGTGAITSTATLVVSKGGTGVGTHTSGNYLKGAGTGNVTSATPAATFADISPLTTRGDLLVGTSGSVTGARLAKGSSGNVLTMADGNDIGWAAASGGGKIVQVLGTTYATAASSSSSTYAASGLSLAITLADDSNKCIVLCQMGGVGKDASNTKCQLKLLRAIDGGAETTIGVEPNAAYNAATSALNSGNGAGWAILDSPATAAEITYHVEFASQNDAAVAYCQTNSATSSITLIEVDA